MHSRNIKYIEPNSQDEVHRMSILNKNTRMCQCIHKYTIHKHIHTNVDVIMAQWNNHSCTGRIYNKLPNTKQNQGVYCVR